MVQRAHDVVDKRKRSVLKHRDLFADYFFARPGCLQSLMDVHVDQARLGLSQATQDVSVYASAFEQCFVRHADSSDRLEHLQHLQVTLQEGLPSESKRGPEPTQQLGIDVELLRSLVDGELLALWVQELPEEGADLAARDRLGQPIGGVSHGFVPTDGHDPHEIELFEL